MAYGRSTVERRQLGLTLRKLRERHGLSQYEAARIVGRKQTRISRAENGVGSLSQEELGKLLDFCDAPAEERDTVLALGVQARKRQRGGAYTDQLPRSFERLADLQAEATAIGFYDTGIVPGLAQSPDYAKSLISVCDGVWWESSEEEVENRLAFRMEQQRRVLEADPPKEVRFILTETALDQVVGSVAVLRGQLEYLLELGQRRNIAVQVVPRDVPSNPLLGGGLITLDFADVAPRIAFTSVIHGPGLYYDQEIDTGPMFEAFETIRKLALSRQETHALLGAKLKEFKP